VCEHKEGVGKSEGVGGRMLERLKGLRRVRESVRLKEFYFLYH